MLRLIWIVLPTLLLGQSAKPPIAHGKAIYTSNCSFCHGAEGEGGRGPALTTSTPLHGATDADLRKVISKGLPGTPMPSFSFEPVEMTALLGHLKGLRLKTVSAEKVTGDAKAGREVYAKLRCNSCHRIGSEGSIYGPSLTRIGAGRNLKYLKESIENPSADIPLEYRGVVVTTAEGAKVNGVRINEDTFSVQLRDIGQKFRMFQKSEAKEVSEMKTSLMPAYTSLNAGDLDNLVAYLASLKGGQTAGQVKQAEGINR